RIVKYRHRVLGFLCLLAAITYLDRVAISVAGPRIQEDLHISPELWGWVVGVFTVSYALFEIPTGRMGDRKGARRILTRVVLWWSAFTSLRNDFELLRAPADTLSVWRRRGRIPAQRRHQHFALVSGR